MSLRATSYLPRSHVQRASRRLFTTTVPKCSEKPVLNRYSRNVTIPKDQGASQVRVDKSHVSVIRLMFDECRQCCTRRMELIHLQISRSLWSVLQVSGEFFRDNLYWNGMLIDDHEGMKATRMFSGPRPCEVFLIIGIYSCNMHILGLGQRIKKSLVEAGIIGYQFGTVGVSDGISMGTRGMSYSLQSRDLIADQVESAAGGHWLDGMVVVPGCDKNMPGVLMARESLCFVP